MASGRVPPSGGGPGGGDPAPKTPASPGTKTAASPGTKTPSAAALAMGAPVLSKPSMPGSLRPEAPSRDTVRETVPPATPPRGNSIRETVPPAIPPRGDTIRSEATLASAEVAAPGQTGPGGSMTSATTTTPAAPGGSTISVSEPPLVAPGGSTISAAAPAPAAESPAPGVVQPAAEVAPGGPTITGTSPSLPNTSLSTTEPPPPGIVQDAPGVVPGVVPPAPQVAVPGVVPPASAPAAPGGPAPAANAKPTELTEKQLAEQKKRQEEQAQYANYAKNKEAYLSQKGHHFNQFTRVDKFDSAKENELKNGAGGLSTEGKKTFEPGVYKHNKSGIEIKYSLNNGVASFTPLINLPANNARLRESVTAALKLASVNGKLDSVTLNWDNPRSVDPSYMKMVLEQAKELGLKVEFGQNIEKAFHERFDHDYNLARPVMSTGLTGQSMGVEEKRQIFTTLDHERQQQNQELERKFTAQPATPAPSKPN